jgi:hypothetical protein
MVLPVTLFGALDAWYLTRTPEPAGRLIVATVGFANPLVVVFSFASSDPFVLETVGALDRFASITAMPLYLSTNAVVPAFVECDQPSGTFSEKPLPLNVTNA